MPSLLVVDEPPEQVETWRDALERAGYRIAMVVPDPAGSGPPSPLRLPTTPPDAIVLGAPTPDCRAWDYLAELRAAGPDLAGVPVVVLVAPGALDDGLRAVVEGAVRCHAHPVAAGDLVGSLDAALAADAPAVGEQRRRARQRALEVLARIEARGAAPDDDAHRRLVHLTRLEPGRSRRTEPEPFARVRERLASLTPKQRALLDHVRREGGVSAAAARLGTSRGNVYAGLRRIVHRLGLRDTRELLRVVGEALPRPEARP